MIVESFQKTGKHGKSKKESTEKKKQKAETRNIVQDPPLDTNKRRIKSTNITKKRIVEHERKKTAVLRTQKWRLKVKLTGTDFNNSLKNIMDS